MGSAAPSPRRWLIVLALVAGAGALALVPALDRPAPPSDRSSDAGVAGDGAEDGAADETGHGRTVEVAGGVGRVVTATVRPEAGWSIPKRIEGDPEDGTLAGARPPGEATVGVRVEVEPGAASFVARSSTDRTLAFRVDTGGSLSPWRALTLGHHEAPDGLPGEEGAGESPPAAVPVLLPPQAVSIELIDRTGDDTSLDIIFLPAFDRPVAGDGFDGPAAPVALGPGAPEIMPRSSWTSAGWASENGSCGGGPEVSEHLQAIVVHHTVTTNDYEADRVDDILRSIHYTHTRINGWCDIGYNFVVDRFGRIWEARTGSANSSVIGGHARGFNTGTLGVALLGQHHDGAWPPVAPVPDVTAAAIEAIANWKLGPEGVDPNGTTWLRNRSSGSRQRLAAETWHLVPTVLGHRDLGLTSCPGSHGMGLVGALPSRLAALRGTALPYVWTGWRPNDHGPAFAVADVAGGIRPAGSAEPWPDAPAGVGQAGEVVAVGGDLSGGYLLTRSGALLGYGTAPAVTAPALSGGAVDLVVRSGGASGWVLDGAGRLRGFGGAAALTPARAVSQPVAVALSDDGRGWVLERSGRLVPVGGAAPATVSPASGARPVDVAIVEGAGARGGLGGGWVLDDSGRLLGFGGRSDSRVESGSRPVAVAAARTEPGGWVLDRDGQLRPFGGARYVIPVSTDAASSGAVDLAQVAHVYSAELLAGPDARYVDRLHRLFLGRDATRAEIDRWVTSLEQGADRIDLTRPLARSESWAGAALDRMYRDVLGREPDPEGRAYWMAEIARGLKLADLGTYFYGSAEYARSSGSDEAYVRRLYQVLLRRGPDPQGLAYWTGEMASGRAAPPDIAAGFYASIESRRARSSRLFEQIMGSTPSSERRDALAALLQSVGDGGLAAELAATADFYHLAIRGAGS